MVDESVQDKRRLAMAVVLLIAVVGFLTYRRNSSSQTTPTPPSQSSQGEASSTSVTPAEKSLTDSELKRQQAQFHKEFEKKQESERIDYAKTMEEVMLHEGFSVDVFTSGPKHTRLTLKYPLVTKSLAYRFGENQSKLREMRDMGFTRFTMTDGYDTTWYWDLK